MASFAHQLEQLLLAAQGRGLVDSGTAERLTALAAERERERGWLSLGGVLGRLGAAVTVLGVILLIAANWHRIGDAVKILGFLLLLGGAHGVGLWIQWTGRPYPRFAEALHFLGAGLFVGGLALVGQIYHLPANPPRAMLVWLGAIAPLAVLLRSPAISGLGVLAAWLWLHFAGADATSPLHVLVFTSYLMLYLGAGLGRRGPGVEPSGTGGSMAAGAALPAAGPAGDDVRRSAADRRGRDSPRPDGERLRVRHDGPVPRRDGDHIGRGLGRVVPAGALAGGLRRPVTAARLREYRRPGVRPWHRHAVHRSDRRSGRYRHAVRAGRGRTARHRVGHGAVAALDRGADRGGHVTRHQLTAGWVGVQLLFFAGWTVREQVRAASGPSILVKVVPVDPRDLLRGQYLRLAYEFSRPWDSTGARLQLPGDAPVWVVLRREGQFHVPKHLSLERPATVAS